MIKGHDTLQFTFCKNHTIKSILEVEEKFVHVYCVCKWTLITLKCICRYLRQCLVTKALTLPDKSNAFCAMDDKGNIYRTLTLSLQTLTLQIYFVLAS